MEKHGTATVRRALENLLKEVDATYDEAINRIEGQATDDRASKRNSCLDYLCPSAVECQITPECLGCCTRNAQHGG
jgi:hypothetical protein